MAEKEVILTLEGLKKLEEELELAKTVKRRKVAIRIKQAIALEILVRTQSTMMPRTNRDLLKEGL